MPTPLLRRPPSALSALLGYPCAPGSGRNGSGLPAWSPGAGWQNVSLASSGEVPISDRWKLSGQVSSARLPGDAGDGPVSKSRYDTNFSLTPWYRFK